MLKSEETKGTYRSRFGTQLDVTFTNVLVLVPDAEVHRSLLLMSLGSELRIEVYQYKLYTSVLRVHHFVSVGVNRLQ